MDFIFVVCCIVLAICVLGLIVSTIVNNQEKKDAIREKEEARASGNCSECNLVPADKKWTYGDKDRYVCEKCYEKLSKEKIDREKALKEKEIAEKPVVIEAAHGTYSYAIDNIVVGSDSAGGWDVRLIVTNRSSKTVKYVYVELIPYNTVGDVGYSPTVGASEKEVQVTGPIYGGDSTTQFVKKCWYDIKMGRIGIGTIKVVFMDGTEKEFRQ